MYKLFSSVSSIPTHDVCAVPRFALPLMGVVLMRAVANAWAMLGLLASLPVAAGTVQFQLQDAAGKPLGDAVVFLESREARALVKRRKAPKWRKRESSSIRRSWSSRSAPRWDFRTATRCATTFIRFHPSRRSTQAVQRRASQSGGFRQDRHCGAGLQHP